MTTPTEHDPWSPPKVASVAPPDLSQANSARRILLLTVVSLGLALVVGQAARAVPPGWRWALPLAVPVGFFGLLLIGGSIRQHRDHWLALEPTFEPFDPAGADTPPPVARHFAAADAALGREGFVAGPTRRTVGSVPNATSYQRVYHHPETLDVARVGVTLVRTPRGERTGSVAAYTTEFADGTEVVTGTRTTPRVYPQYPPPFHGLVFPEVVELGRLLDAHRAHVAGYETGRVRVDPLGDDPIATLRRKDHRRLVDHLVALGYAWNDEAAGRQRFTWKGATLITWRLIPPFRQVGLARERRAARRRLDRLQRALTSRVGRT